MCLEFDVICTTSVANHDQPGQFAFIPYQTLQTITSVTPSPLKPQPPHLISHLMTCVSSFMLHYLISHPQLTYLNLINPFFIHYVNTTFIVARAAPSIYLQRYVPQHVHHCLRRVWLNHPRSHHLTTIIFPSLAHVSSTTDNAMTLISPLFLKSSREEDGSFW